MEGVLRKVMVKGLIDCQKEISGTSVCTWRLLLFLFSPFVSVSCLEELAGLIWYLCVIIAEKQKSKKKADELLLYISYLIQKCHELAFPCPLLHGTTNDIAKLYESYNGLRGVEIYFIAIKESRIEQAFETQSERMVLDIILVI